MVDWRLVLLFVVGGAIGGLLGMALGRMLAGRKRALSLTFATIVIGVGGYVVATSLGR
jgi:uncharacterized membrane protein YfcA